VTTPYRLHHVRVTVPNGVTVLARVELDGEELRGVSVVSFVADVDGGAQVTLRLHADVEIEGELPIVKEWRRLRPSWFRRAADHVAGLLA
jgi:hypothetical protein